MNPQLLWNALIFPFQPEEKGRVLLDTPLKQFWLVFFLAVVFWLWSIFAGWQGAASFVNISMGLVASAFSIWLNSQLMKMIGVNIRFIDLVKFYLASGLFLMVLSPLLLPHLKGAETDNVLVLGVGLMVVFWYIVAYCIALGRYHHRSPWAIFGISLLAGILFSIVGFALGALGLPMEGWNGFNTVYLKPN